MQVWNAIVGNKLYTFEGHKAPAYPMCPDNKEKIQVFSCFICTFVVDSFSLTFHERHQRLVSHASARALGSRYYSVHLFYTLAMLAGGSCIN